MDKKNIDWDYLSSNPNYKALEILEKNQDKINWNYLSLNPSIFILDYEAMKKNMETLEEELLQVVLHPKRVLRNLELYGYDMEDMYD